MRLRVKTAAEMKYPMPEKLITSLDWFPITSVEMDKDSLIKFYINLDSSNIGYECQDLIRNFIESQDRAKCIGWTWNNAKMELSIRLRVIINSDWNASSTDLEVCYKDKENKNISGKLYFVNVVKELRLKEIIIDAIRAKLFQ